MYQYRIKVNGSIGDILDSMPDWSGVVERCEARGYTAELQRRLVTDRGMRELLGDYTKGWIFLKDKSISPWETFAEVR